MKKSKKSNIVIVLVVLLLALAVGYAAFSTELNITGTATTRTGNWDVRFTNAEITDSFVTDAANDQNKAEVASDGKSVSVDAYLQAPGDGVNVTATISNEGILDAELNEFKVTNPTDADIIVTVPDTTDKDIAAGESRDFVFSVEWDANSTATTSDKTASFVITFTYVQGGETFTGTQSFELN